MNTLNRRQFLKTIASAGAALMLPKAAAAAPQNAIYVPPSVMLHSRHWRVLPDLLANLRDLGYQGVTYNDWEQVILDKATFPLQPVILSVDDLSCEVGNPAFRYFQQMQEDFVEAGFKAVFAVITRPNLQQDEDRWAEIAGWVGQGIELATHTAYHSNLDNPKFIAEDYSSEIVDSAAMIEARTGQAVRTLITPYGSGYDIKNRALNPYVLEACRQGNLRFMIGISTGQRHIHLDTQAGDVIYAGRANPGNAHTVNDSLYYIKYW